MVQKQAAFNSRLGGEDFADDDPLAELARIVGFEPPAARDVPREPQVVESPAAPVAPVDAPFSLEDELLREFENYDRGQPVAAHVEPVMAPLDVAPDVEESVPVLDAIDEGEELDLNTAGANEAVLAEAEETFRSAEQAFVPETAGTMSSDLADELEMAVSAAPVEPVWPKGDAEPRLRLPLANFHVPQPSAPRVEPSFAMEREEPVAAAVDEAPRLTPVETSNWMSGTGLQTIERAASDNTPAQQPLPVSDFDVFPEGASSYDAPAVASPERSPEFSAPAARAEPDSSFSFADEFAADEDRSGSVPQAAVEPSAAPVAAPSAAIDEDAFDPFADGAFELDLDDIELDFSDLEIEPEPQQPATAESLRGEAAAVIAPPSMPVEAERHAVAPEAAATVSSVPAFVATPVAAPAMPEDEELPFDLSEIAEQDENPETIATLDVPEIPVHEHKEPVAPRHDYELDIDTELATLLSDAVVPATAAPAAAPTAATVTAAAPAVADDFEAFEKALEQDLKRSYEGEKGFAGAVNRIPLQSTAEEIDYDEPRPSRARLLAASAAGVLVLLAGGGLYAWMTGSESSVLGSGEPVVIAADKEPVKVVPENKGGKTVPNQDKAVYDRVAGAAVDDPKQPSLISSSEEPVDVVQKTLIPETLPLEGENEPDAMPTPVGETEDPRLLPSDQSADQQAAGNTSDPVTITPRKVRTMIVRPDGTLVAQEVEQPAAEATTTQTPTAPALASPTAEPAGQTPLAPAVPTDTANQQAAAELAAPTTAQPAISGAVTPAAETAAAPVEAAPAATTAAPAVSAPVPTARPAEQPVNVVSTVTERGNVKPVETAAASPASVVPAGSYVIQIASLPSEADAEKSYKNLSAKFSGVIGGRAYEIKKAEIAGKGTYYRVRIAGGTKDEAVALCERYRAAGGTCLVAK